MKKSDIASILSTQIGVTSAVANDAVTVVFEVIQDALSKKEEVSISGFGKFNAKDTKARKGINPKTKEVINIPAKVKVTFKSSSKLVEELNA